MKAAEEIIKTHLGGNMNLKSLTPFALAEIINIARKEAIEECYNMVIPDGNPQSLQKKFLNLIKELK